MSLFYYPFILQGALMTADEFYFHERRGLPQWEKIGHPLDSLLTFITLAFPAFFPYTDLMFKIFVGFAIFSCFFITKDEFIHSERCSKEEHWVHAVLFMLHPVVFMMTALIWKNSVNDDFLKVQSLVVGGFMFYQIIRWSFPWNKRLK